MKAAFTNPEIRFNLRSWSTAQLSKCYHKNFVQTWFKYIPNHATSKIKQNKRIYCMISILYSQTTHFPISYLVRWVEKNICTKEFSRHMRLFYLLLCLQRENISSLERTLYFLKTTSNQPKIIRDNHRQLYIMQPFSFF